MSEQQSKDKFVELAALHGVLPPVNKPEDVGNAVWALYERGLREMKPWYSVINEYRRYYRGEQLVRMPKHKSKVVENEIFTIIESEKPRIAQMIGTPDLKPEDPNDEEAVRALSQRVRSAWKKSKVRDQLPEVIHDILVDGGAYMKAFYDRSRYIPMASQDSSNRAWKEGDIAFTRINNRRIIRDPDAPDFYSSMWVMDRVLGTVSETKAMYGKPMKDFSPTERQLDGEQDAPEGPPDVGNTNIQIGTAFAPVGESSPVTRYSEGIGDKIERSERLLRIECWFWDQSTKKTEEDIVEPVEREVFDELGNPVLDEMGEQTLRETKEEVVGKKMTEEPLYPHGRIVTIAVGARSSGEAVSDKEGNRDITVLMDRPSPFKALAERLGIFPIVYIPCYPTDDIWAMSEVAQLLPLQDGLNKALNVTMDNFNLQNAPRTYTNRSTGIRTGTITNRPGEVIIIEGDMPASQAVFVDRPDLIARQALPIADYYRGRIDDVSGQHDATQGRKPAGIESGVAIGILIEQGSGRPQLKAARITAGLVRLFEMGACIAQDFDEDNESFYVADDSKDIREFVEYSPFESKNVTFEAAGVIRHSMEQLAQVFQAMAIMEQAGIPGELLIENEDDPTLSRLYNKKIKERRQQEEGAKLLEQLAGSMGKNTPQK